MARETGEGAKEREARVQVVAGRGRLMSLYKAVEVAIDPQARGRGVLAVLDGEIHGARAVTKVATQGVGAFRSTGSGPLGWVDDAGVHLLRQRPSRRCPYW